MLKPALSDIFHHQKIQNYQVNISWSNLLDHFLGKRRTNALQNEFHYQIYTLSQLISTTTFLIHQLEKHYFQNV